MDTGKYDETTTIAITLHNRERLKTYKIIEAESWNHVIGRLLDSIDEAKLRIDEK